MNKKILALLFVVVSQNTLFACYCMPSNTYYMAYETTIKTSLKAQDGAIEALIKVIDKETESIKEQTKLLEKNNKIIKENIIKSSETIFLLEQKNNLR